MWLICIIVIISKILKKLNENKFVKLLFNVMSTVKLKNYLPLPYGPPMFIAVKDKFTPIVREDSSNKEQN